MTNAKERLRHNVLLLVDKVHYIPCPVPPVCYESQYELDLRVPLITVIPQSPFVENSALALVNQIGYPD